MDVERWRRIADLYQAAVEREPGRRAAFLTEACQGDEKLRQQVERLLESSPGILDQPVLKHAAAMFEDGTATMLGSGTRLGPYEVLAPLGSGGMGQVYRARDTRLGRDVAIKVSAHQFTGRFEREARAIAALNHPHICTLYDVGPNYLVMELVDGETLAAHIRRGPLAIQQLLDYGIQIAGALSAAHSLGIIHRDLKPGNVMIGGNGIKVLDFGLANPPERPGDTETITGVVMGTPAYMAPEQLEGKHGDARTDIFSLGLVLYEMATGRLPYPGASYGGILATTEGRVAVERPSRIRRGLPAKLDSMIARALEKEPDHRIQSAADVIRDLDRLRRPRRIQAAGAAALLVLAAIGLWQVTAPRRASAPLVYTRLTDFPDSVHSPALSKDGKMLAFVRGTVDFLGGSGEIYLKVLPDGQPVMLTNDGDKKIAPVFTPDGSRIVYTATNKEWSSFSIPVGGGQPALFMRNAAALRWIGPGQVLFSEGKHAPLMGIVTASEIGGQARDVYVPASPLGMAHFSELSPDGKWVLVVEMDANAWLPCRVVPFDGSSVGKRVGPPAAECTSATWSRDGRWMYFAATINGESHLWRQAFPDGRPEQITSGLNQERGLAVDPVDGSLITSVGSAQSTVWYTDENGSRAVSAEGYAYRPEISPDGLKVFYLIRRSVKRAFWVGELWSTDLATGRNERVLPDFLVRYYDLSRDGTYVVFDAFDKSERSRLWVASTDRRRPPHRLTADGEIEEQRPIFGSSGTIYFVQEQAQSRFLWRMKPDGSARQKLSPAQITFLVNVSPDENWAVLWGPPQGAVFLPLTGGSEQVLCNCAIGPIFQDAPRVNWSGDAKWLYVTGAVGDNGTFAIPWHGGQTLALAQNGLAAFPGAQRLRETSVAPGPFGGRYAFTRRAEQSNLFRIRLP